MRGVDFISLHVKTYCINHCSCYFELATRVFCEGLPLTITVNSTAYAGNDWPLERGNTEAVYLPTFARATADFKWAGEHRSGYKTDISLQSVWNLMSTKLDQQTILSIKIFPCDTLCNFYSLNPVPTKPFTARIQTFPGFWSRFSVIELQPHPL